MWSTSFLRNARERLLIQPMSQITQAFAQTLGELDINALRRPCGSAAA
ncbi:hypothetical protein [Burkholderia gladioli]|nr:hypothetical protein [Burkholderia gladioli]